MSAYKDPYLESMAKSRNPITPAAYLAVHLKGRAKKHAGHHLIDLVYALKDDPDVVQCRSVSGGIAYRRKPNISS